MTELPDNYDDGVDPEVAANWKSTDEPRRIVQLLMPNGAPSASGTLVYALCNDGTIWVSLGREWVRGSFYDISQDG